MESEYTISIWFFIGICLLFDGLLTFGAGLYQLGHPPVHPVVLYSLHANIWWGAVLALTGLLSGRATAPWRQKANKK